MMHISGQIIITFSLVIPNVTKGSQNACQDIIFRINTIYTTMHHFFKNRESMLKDVIKVQWM